jgi:DNA replication protein DnaC
MVTPGQREGLCEHLRKLQLLNSGERLEALLQPVAAKELHFAQFFEQAFGEEVAAKTSKNIALRTAMAPFAFVKPMQTFDFGHQPSIDRKQVQQPATGHFVEHGDNLIDRAAQRGQDAPGRLTGHQGHPALSRMRKKCGLHFAAT